MAGIVPDILLTDIEDGDESNFQILEQITRSLEGLAFALSGKASLVLSSQVVNGDPPSSAPSFLDPTGDIARDDQFNGYEIIMTSGTADGTVYIITDTTESDNRIHVAENLFADGVRDADTFRIKGHRHDGQVGADVKVTDLLGFVGGAWLKDSIVPQISGACPSGWTDISATYDNRFVGPTTTAVATSGSSAHGHASSANLTGGLNAGARSQTPSVDSVAAIMNHITGQANHHMTSADLISATHEPLFRTIKLCKKN